MALGTAPEVPPERCPGLGSSPNNSKLLGTAPEVPPEVPPERCPGLGSSPNNSKLLGTAPEVPPERCPDLGSSHNNSLGALTTTPALGHRSGGTSGAVPRLWELSQQLQPLGTAPEVPPERCPGLGSSPNNSKLLGAAPEVPPERCPNVRTAVLIVF